MSDQYSSQPTGEEPQQSWSSQPVAGPPYGYSGQPAQPQPGQPFPGQPAYGQPHPDRQGFEQPFPGQPGGAGSGGLSPFAPGQQAGLHAAPDRRRLRKIVLLVGSAVALLAIVLGTVTYVAFGRSGPDDAVNSYLRAAKDNNRAAALDLICAQYRTLVLSYGLSSGYSDDGSTIESWKILKVQQAERTAVVTVEIKIRKTGEIVTETEDVVLVTEDGEWRICGGNEGIRHD